VLGVSLTSDGPVSPRGSRGENRPPWAASAPESTTGGGVPRGLAGAGANRHAGTMVRTTLESLPVAPPEPTLEPPQGRGVDQGDDADAGRAWRIDVGVTAPIRARGEAAQALQPEAGDKARRWGGERTHRGLPRDRRVVSRGEKNVGHDLACLHGAGADRTYRQSGLLD
jgi:hypothetical protein